MRPWIPIVLAAVLATPALASHGNSTANPIQPGDRLSTPVGDCTLAFVLDGTGAHAGKVYFATAGHCVSAVGQSVSADGWPGFGTVAWFRDNGLNDDMALLLVNEDKEHLVHAEVRGHPGMPAGVTASTETRQGDVLRFSGYGMGYGFTGPTREERVGVLVSDDATQYNMLGPVIFGDSGGPILHDSTGKALGIVNGVDVGGGRMNGVTMEGLLAKAAAAGFTLQLRTA